MIPESGVIWSVEWLFYCQFGRRRQVFRAPQWLENIQRCFLQPGQLPLLQSKVFEGQQFLHLGQKVVNSCVFPFVFVEIWAESLWKVLLSHQVTELLHSGCSLRVGYAIKNGVSHIGVGDWASYGMSSNHLVMKISSSFGLVESGPRWLISQSLEISLDFIQAEVGDKSGKGLVEPEIIPPRHGNKVAKPLMGQLMANHCGHPLLVVGGALLGVEQEICFTVAKR